MDGGNGPAKCDLVGDRPDRDPGSGQQLNAGRKLRGSSGLPTCPAPWRRTPIRSGPIGGEADVGQERLAVFPLASRLHNGAENWPEMAGPETLRSDGK